MEYIDRSTSQNDKAILNGASSLVFNPAYILHCKYSFGFLTDPGSGEAILRFRRTLKAYKPDGYTSIDGFIDEVWRDHIKGTEIYPVPPRQPSASPFDIGVGRPCFLVIELDKTRNWMFSQHKTAVTKKDKAYAGEDGAVYHVRPSTGRGETGHIQDEECRIVHFEVLARADMNERLYDFNVRFIDGGYAIETVIDPDIPNTGAAPFPP